MEAVGTPQRAPRAAHKHSKTASNTPPSSKTNKAQQPVAVPQPKELRNTNTNAHNGQGSAGENSVVDKSTEAHFDSNGRFVMGTQQDLGMGGTPGRGASGKRPPKNQPGHVNNTRRPSGQQHMPISHAPHHQAPPSAVTPAKQAAYAGPTFHASPAASALPMPTFMSRSMPAAAASTENSLQTRLDQEPSSSDQSSENSPSLPGSNPAAVPEPRREESPLDFFFNAHRAEKAKLASTPAPGPGPVTPNGRPPLSTFQSALPQANTMDWSTIYGVTNNNRRHNRTFSSGSGRDMFALELDGTSAPAPSHAPHSFPRQPSQELSSSSSAPSMKRLSQTESLKNFLNSTMQNSPPSPHRPTPDRAASGYASEQLNGSPVYRHQMRDQMRSFSGPSTPVAQKQQQGGNELHYGNRNLSPLFHAAKNGTGSEKRSSGLRREVPSSPTANGIVEMPVLHASQPNLAFSGNNHYHNHNEHMYAQGRRQQPHQQASSRSTDMNRPPHYLQAHLPHPPATPLRSKSEGNVQPSAAGSAANVQSMEDDLRRILKLTAYGGDGKGSGPRGGL